MIPLQSFQGRLTSELEEIEAAIVGLWRKSGIEEFHNDPRSLVVFLTHQFCWKTLAPEHRGVQAQLNAKYKRWCELLNRCHSQHSSDVQRDIKETSDYVSSAIELQTGWFTERTLDQNVTYLASRLDVFRQLLMHAASGTKDLVLVPDTNALLKSTDPSDYGDLVDSKTFRFVIAPTVLAELDELKRLRGTQPVGQKADKAIRVIKGWRTQGSVMDGVIVGKTVTVKMISTEPRMSELPSWLDADNKDDRIIGTVLEIQCSETSAVVVLVTDDMNLQNKAEMAFLPWAEAPDPPASPALP